MFYVYSSFYLFSYNLLCGYFNYIITRFVFGCIHFFEININANSYVNIKQLALPGCEELD